MPVYVQQGLEQQSQSFEAFPAGDYNLIISDIADGPFGNGAGHKVDITLEVIDGEYKGRKIFDMIALVHVNPEWAQGTQARLDAICAVAGFPSLDAFSQLLNTMVRAKIFIEKDKSGEYDPKNKIDKILGPAVAGAAPASMAAPAPAPPTQMSMQPPSPNTTVAPPAQMTMQTPVQAAAQSVTQPVTQPAMQPLVQPAMQPPVQPPLPAQTVMQPPAPPAPVAAPVPPAPVARQVAMAPTGYDDGSTWDTAVYTDTGEFVAVGQPGYAAPINTVAAPAPDDIFDDDIPF